ncbi:Carboxypeptidase T (modular protein) [Crenothrix polyspora]|uniref:carboxypeptidase T n=1 Tax=Crenothrix polyspora TaxID=360316 RepID=A0A1R4H6V0_9GAMM|nr:M14 family metallopeptidase [Crenothrix polyspora]SJM91983.1 Carboxypeptidase T (modular protein) [Crenothrix polyspora]
MSRFKHFLVFFLIPLLSVSLFSIGISQAAALTKQTSSVYKVERVFNAINRSKIANTGALILEAGHAYVLVEATLSEKKAIAQLGFSIAPPTQDEGKLLASLATDSAYHDYAEMVAEIQQAEIDHPAIFKLFNLGLSAEGRTIWAGKISDKVEKDEPEPEVLLAHHQHAREHLTVEQALYTLKMLTREYGVNQQITRLVNDREIWIIFDMNPDGGEYDTATGSYRSWRKNRQLNAKSKALGSDLNRNWDYVWGCCDGSKAVPSSPTYHGDTGFSAPETKVVRDFVNSRVLNGKQQIKVAIDFHSYSELILWPYSYTLADVPVDMTKDDHDVLVAMGKKMAKLNGYAPKQWSDMYIADGTLNDWLYGVHGILNYTFEMAPKTQAQGGFYPSDDVIPKETARNRAAILYLMAQAACPYSEIGKKAQYCDTVTTGFYSPGDDAAVSRDAGDNNGYDISPINAYSHQKVSAIDINSGTGKGLTCDDKGKDRHDFYDYFINIPKEAKIKGIEVKLYAKADSALDQPHICTQLSWDGGQTWTAPKLTSTLTTSLQAYTLGGILDTWGRTWTSNDLANNNFKVRLTNVAGSPLRDFSLDWLAVRVKY